MTYQIVSFVSSIHDRLSDIYNWFRTQSEKPVCQWICIAFGSIIGMMCALADMKLHPEFFPSLPSKSLYLIKCTTVTTSVASLPFTTLSVGPILFWVFLVNLVRKDVGSFRIKNGF